MLLFHLDHQMYNTKFGYVNIINGVSKLASEPLSLDE